MSIKMMMELKALQKDFKEIKARLDNSEKAVNTLKKAVSHIERNPAGKSGVRVPRTDLPETLDKLEIGRNPQGT